MSDDEDSRPPVDLGPDRGGPRWRAELVEETTSTNADVAERFRGGEREGLVLVAEHQTAGRGRLGREWVSPSRSSLIVSFLLVPEDVPAERWPWLPLLTGVAAAAAVRRVTGVQVDLKWPNDVLADGQKLAGILLERVDHGGSAAAVVGIGINCAQTAEELPVPEATSLSIVTGAPVDRSELLAALLEELAARYDEWRSGAGLRARLSRAVRDAGAGRAGRRTRWRGDRPGGGRGRRRAARRTHGGRRRASRRGRRRARPRSVATFSGVPPWHDRAVAISRKHLNEGEHVILSTRTHVKVLVLPAVVLIVIAGLAGYLSSLPNGAHDGTWRWVIWVIAAVLLCWFSIAPFLSWLLTTYTFTSRRLITRTGVFTRRGHDIPLNRISDISYEKGLIDRIFGCGTLVVSDASELGRVELKDIPHVEQAQLTVSDELFHRADPATPRSDDGS